jgi:cytosine/adenosine deaminase-related metal-dependent hydrolase
VPASAPGRGRVADELRVGLLLRGARCLGGDGWSAPRDLRVEGGTVRGGPGPGGEAEVDIAGRCLLPALVNAYDVLDLSTLPPLGSPPYETLYDWVRGSEEELSALGPALGVPLVDRLFLGGLRNLLAGAAAVLHHHPDHRSLSREDFPVRVQRRYGFAHSPGLTPALRPTYRSSDRRVPWVVRAAEGRTPGQRAELDALAAANVLRQNTVIAHGTALAPEDGPRLAAAGAALAWCPESDRRLYGRTAPAAALVAAGVAVGLGSDAPSSGARDALSNLAAARREGLFDDLALLRLATAGSAGVARLPAGGLEDGAPADLLAADSPEGLLGGGRAAVALLLVRGRAVYGEPSLLQAAGVDARPLRVDGEPRALEARLAARLATILRRAPGARRAVWLAGVAL